MLHVFPLSLISNWRTSYKTKSQITRQAVKTLLLAEARGPHGLYLCYILSTYLTNKLCTILNNSISISFIKQCKQISHSNRNIIIYDNCDNILNWLVAMSHQLILCRIISFSETLRNAHSCEIGTLLKWLECQKWGCEEVAK